MFMCLCVYMNCNMMCVYDVECCRCSRFACGTENKKEAKQWLTVLCIPRSHCKQACAARARERASVRTHTHTHGAPYERPRIFTIYHFFMQIKTITISLLMMFEYFRIRISATGNRVYCNWHLLGHSTYVIIFWTHLLAQSSSSNNKKKHGKFKFVQKKFRNDWIIIKKIWKAWWRTERIVVYL